MKTLAVLSILATGCSSLSTATITRTDEAVSVRHQAPVIEGRIASSDVDTLHVEQACTDGHTDKRDVSRHDVLNIHYSAQTTTDVGGALLLTGFAAGVWAIANHVSCNTVDCNPNSGLQTGLEVSAAAAGGLGLVMMVVGVVNTNAAKKLAEPPSSSVNMTPNGVRGGF